MSHAEKCPVCMGTGQIVKGYCGTAGIDMTVNCHGCGGLGWVTVQDPPQYDITGAPISAYVKLKESHEE